MKPVTLRRSARRVAMATEGTIVIPIKAFRRLLEYGGTDQLNAYLESLLVIELGVEVMPYLDVRRDAKQPKNADIVINWNVMEGIAN